IEQFQKYIRYGYYPYFLENQNLYHQKLFETIEISLSTDLPSVYDITYGSVEKMRQLLYILAESVPFTPNITKISERMGVTRSTLLHFLYYLEELRVIKKLYSTTKGISMLQKPEKLYLHHPNYFHALSAENINSGSIRESFFLNQVGALFPVTYAKTGDFIANKLVFETGGQNKNRKQIVGAGDKGFVVADDLEIGYKNKIPLWMFGLLY
ncbi:MAG: ATP-binding protein, partial [Bacteroidetes bacterium]|nr:ATP-binding protein [Bacteroidota bacterium]